MMDELDETWRRAVLDDLAVIWNRACDYGADGEAPEGTPLGIVHLSFLLRVYNSAMGGGLGFAVEVNEPFRLRRAIEAMRYFRLSELADLLTDVLNHESDVEYAGSRERQFYYLLGPADENLDKAFRAKAAEAPSDFGLR
ncbi:hypothetical protein [Micromonospora sp. MA102]|uniref:hypothetical protein n=1 Tax=Micromonospora sp. MA102 TaxID=2952755 RepID=UPI0021C711F5|nr:hypothetical protein [Micromonospora sp. MA102]